MPVSLSSLYYAQSNSLTTLTSSNLVIAGPATITGSLGVGGNSIVVNSMIPLSALSNSINLSTLGGQLLPSAYSNSSIPLSALSNVSISSTTQPLVGYNTISMTSVLTSTPTPIIFSNLYSSQGTSGISYSNGVFTNKSGSPIVTQINYSLNFSSNSSIGVRECYITDGTLTYGVNAVPGNSLDTPWVSGSASIKMPVNSFVEIMAYQDSGSTLTAGGSVQIVPLTAPFLLSTTTQPLLSYSMSAPLIIQPSTTTPSLFNTISQQQGTTGLTYSNALFTNTSGSPFVVSASYTTNFTLQTSSTGVRMCYLTDGTNTYGTQTIAGNSLDTPYISGNANILLPAGSSVSLQVYQSSAATLSYSSTIQFATLSSSSTSSSSLFSSNVTVQGNLLVAGSNNAYSYPCDTTYQTSMISAGNLGMFRNRIINGSLGINQRATTTLSLSATTATYLVDRFCAWYSVVPTTGSVAYSLLSLTLSDAPYQVAGHLSAVQFLGTSTLPGSFSGFAQAIEGLNITDLAWGTPYAKTITVSFWIKSSLAAGSLVSVTISNYALAGETAPTYNSSVTISASGTWQYSTLVIPGPTTGTWSTTNAGALWLMIGSQSTTPAPVANVWNSSTPYYVAPGMANWISTTNSLTLAGIQLEKGSIATPFEFRPYPIELSLCQRYFQSFGSTLGNTRIGVAIGGGGVIDMPLMLKAPLRSTAYNISSSTNNNINYVTGGVSATQSVSSLMNITGDGDERCIYLRLSSSSTSTYTVYISLSTFLYFSAEL